MKRWPRVPVARALIRVLVSVFALFAWAVLPAANASAHPLGNFSVNQYSKLVVGRDAVSLTYILDLAELPTVTNSQTFDADGDGSLSQSERDKLQETVLAEIAPRLHLSAGGTLLPLALQSADIAFLPGQANLETTRLSAKFQATMPSNLNSADLTFGNDYATDRVGWREIVVVNGADVALPDAVTLALDRSQALTVYPQDLLSSPLDERSVTFSATSAPGSPAADANTTNQATSPLDFGARLAELVNGSVNSPAGLLLALLAAALWGAMHALSPGHGKTVVGAYLVGSRGTPRHALFLGLTVTLTHTIGVVVLGVVILLASRTIVPELFYPWLSLISGLMVVLVGLSILRQRLTSLRPRGVLVEDLTHGEHDHHHHGLTGGHVHSHNGHTHSHLPPEDQGSRVTWRSLFALGVSGGLLPCPSALLALLGSVALGRAGFGLAVVVAFSLGLAATLTGVGLLFLYAGRYLQGRRLPGASSQLLRFAPAAAALAVTASGALIVLRAVSDLW